MRRRQFITLLASLAIYRPCAALARVASKLPRIGFLAGGSRPDSFGTNAYAGFLQGMKELGYVEERDFVMEWRFAEGQYDRFPSLVAELVRLPVDIVVVGTPAAVKLVQQATRTVPIVMGLSTDPVASGFVDSLARPGGNTTGVATSQEEICLKHLSILKVLVPEVSVVGFAKNPGNPSHSDVQRILERAGFANLNRSISGVSA
jgi:putative tryptophan/tyrosine transport system substrate-binding protein